MAKTNLLDFVDLSKIEDDAILCVAEAEKDIPFKFQRVYYITKPKIGEPRGCHAHKKNQQVIFCLNGEVRLTLDNGKTKQTVVLNDPAKGLVLKPLIWHEMRDMDENTILLIFASDLYDPGDYIRNYEQFKKLV